MTRRFIVMFIAAVALSCASDPDRNATLNREPQGYSGLEVGPSPVGSIPDVVLHDNARNKDVTVTIDYPTRGGPNPVIVFSPGYGGTNRGYVGLASYWAGNNYVVFRVNHGNLIQASRVKSAEDVWAQSTPADWRNRVQDIELVLGSLQDLTKRFPELEGKIDATKIGVAGHSFGAHTAMLLGGARTFPGAVSYADPRIKAIVALSPDGPSDTRGFTNESFASINVPALFITGTKDQGTTESETPEWRSQAFKLAPAGDKWLLTIENARHATFTGRTDDLLEASARQRGAQIPSAARTPMDDNTRLRTGPDNLAMRQLDMFGIARASALAFFNTYLRGDATAREALEKMKERHGVTLEMK